MASKNFLDVNPAFNRKASIALLDTAEELVDSLDNVAVCLKNVEERYLEHPNGAESRTDGDSSLCDKLKESLDTAHDLTDTLKREKWRLSRRELSLNLRMGELEDYKKHMKEDMTDMNQTVEALSMRVVQLENALCDQQELQEAIEAENTELKKRLKESEQRYKKLEDQKTQIQLELKRSQLQRKDSYLKKQTDEMLSEMEVLRLENRNLKDMIREKDEILDNQTCSQDDVVNNFVANDAHTGFTDTGGHRRDINSQGIVMQPEQECQIEYV